MSPTLIQKIAMNCIAKELKNSIFAKIKERLFSMSMDSSNDIYGTSYLAVSVKYHEEEGNCRFPINKLISVIPMENLSTGQVIIDKIKNKILLDSEVQKNLMGIAINEGKDMIGEEKGASSRLAKDFPHIVQIKDFSHVYNLVFKDAIEGFPKEIVEIVSTILRHFKKSAQRN